MDGRLRKQCAVAFRVIIFATTTVYLHSYLKLSVGCVVEAPTTAPFSQANRIAVGLSSFDQTDPFHIPKVYSCFAITTQQRK